ncbi:DEKNAAC104588 [Brettanomyces naardenensis]|uniref:DEKNAAC104588 n=1 Tax=Brettanomyces naardenensis TaxID=13370 RepID=A0A448YRN9_BRENA|nr:DEKNAAC104588 [Brettanomyces naardenensis]
MDYEKVVYYPPLTKLLAFLDTTAGREKLLRTVQYLVRFLAYNLKDDPVQYLFYKNLQQIFGLSRKPLRFLKFLQNWKSLLIDLNDQLKDSQLRTFEGIKQFGFGVYFVLDAIQWFKLLGFFKGRKQSKLVAKADVYGYRFWLLALTGALLHNLRQLQISSSRRKELQKQSLVSSETGHPIDYPTLMQQEDIKISTTSRDLIKNALDSVIALNGCHIITASEGVVGASGLVTSLMGLRDLWRNTKIKA